MRDLAGRLLPWLPLAALIAIAVNHFVLVRCCDLHPWLGGGFGMFSTVDARALGAWRVESRGEERLAVPRGLEDQAKRAEALPTEDRLAALARELVKATSASPRDGAGAAERVAVRVEVWETRFDREMRPEPRRLRSVTVDGGSGR